MRCSEGGEKQSKVKKVGKVKATFFRTEMRTDNYPGGEKR
jgi:hypothetical protein